MGAAGVGGCEGEWPFSTYSNYTEYDEKTGQYLENDRSYKIMYEYYKPQTYHYLGNYYDPIGYHSNTFAITYYNGYGYNFYYGEYNYYEFSPNDEEPNYSEFWFAIAGVLIALIALLLIGLNIDPCYESCMKSWEESKRGKF